MGNDFTVGDLRRRLQAFNDDDKLMFSGGLTFYRLKAWGDDEVFLEFNEPPGHLSDEFKSRNPQVKVAFINTGGAEWDEAGVVGGPIDVNVS